MDNVRYLVEEKIARARQDPSFAVRALVGFVLGLTGFILFCIEAHRSSVASNNENFVLTFPQQADTMALKEGVSLPSALVCPIFPVTTPNLVGQIKDLSCKTKGFLAGFEPTVTVLKTSYFINDVEEKAEQYACFSVNANLGVKINLPSQNIQCDATFFNYFVDPLIRVTFYDPRQGSLDSLPSVEEQWWHSLQPFSLNQYWIEPTEIKMFDRTLWVHKPHHGQILPFNTTAVVNNPTLPGASLNYGLQTMWYTQLTQINFFPTNVFLGVCGGLVYFLVGLFSLAMLLANLAGLGSPDQQGTYAVMPQSGNVGSAAESAPSASVGGYGSI